MCAGTTLQKQDSIVIGNIQQFAQVLLRLLENGDNLWRAMAHFHHGQAGAAKIQHLLGGLAQNRLGKCGGAGAEIEIALGHVSFNLVTSHAVARRTH